MIKIFIIGASSKLARRFILNTKLNNVIFSGTYNKNNMYRVLKKKLPNTNFQNFIKINLIYDKDLKKISNILIKSKPDIIINFSSVLIKRKKLKEVSFKYLMEVFNLNFFSQFKLYSKICSKLNKLKKRVLIINVSSKVILNGGYNIYEYSTSKAATANLIKCLHREFNNLKFINLVLPTVGNIKNKQTITYKIFINYLSNIIKNYKKMKNYKTKIIK